MNEKMDVKMRETVESLENLELESVEAGRNAGLAGSCAKLYLPNRKRDTIEVEQEHPNRSSSSPPPLLPASAAFEPTKLKLTKPQSSGGTIDIQLEERHLEEHQQRAQETNSGAGVSEHEHAHEHENIILASNIASVQPHTSLDTRLEQRLEKSLETVEKVGKVLEKKVERDEKGEEKE